MLIGDLLQRRARISPEAVYWESAGRAWRYGEVNAAANRLTRALLGAGLGPGNTVGIHADGGIAYAIVHFATAKAGLVLAHLNPRYTADELAWGAHHAGCAAVFFGAAQTRVVAEARGQLRGVQHWIALDDGGAAEPPAWAQSMSPWCEPHAEREPPPPPGVDERAPFQLLFTSGTTGRPKGALISHRSKLRLGQTHALNIGLRVDDRVLSSLPMHHHYAQWLLLVAVPLVGATVVQHPRFDPDATWAALEAQAITHLPAVPTTLHRLLGALPRPMPALPALRHVVYGSAPMPPALIRRLREALPGVRLMQGFGQTETGSCLVLHDADHERRPDSLGKPDIFSEIRLLDEAGREVPPGEVGEIVARTPYLMNGYLNDPEATAAYFRHGADWGRTGDLAWQDDEGWYFLAGRRQELIISGGVNVYPAEVERVLLAHPAVREAAVYGVPDEEWGEAVTAAVILHPPVGEANGASARDLDAHCREHLAGFKCPKTLRLLEDFPRNASGKVLKGELPR